MSPLVTCMEADLLMAATRDRPGRPDGPLSYRSTLRHRLGVRVRLHRALRQIADGGRLEPDRRRHRTAGRRRAGDGGLRLRRPAGLAPRGAQHMPRTVVLYGLVPIAGAQLFYYNAVSHLSVGVALLLEYTAPILVVGWLWATTRETAHHPDAGRRRARRRRNHAGARASIGPGGLTGRPDQPRRRRLGPGRGGLRGVLLPDVRQGRRRRPRRTGRGCTRSRWPPAACVVGAVAVAAAGRRPA